MKLSVLLLVLWATSSIGCAITIIKSTISPSVMPPENHLPSLSLPSSSAPPNLHEYNDFSTTPIPPRQITTSSTTKATSSPAPGATSYSGPQIFATTYMCVFGAVMLGCLVWICSGNRHGG
ncbi:hypothetical protein WAI453_007466 [Rhynchosporium graminicola]